MSTADSPLPTRRRDLVIRPMGDAGQYVIKDPRTGEFFQLGEQTHFLLMQLDGANDAGAVCRAFTERFEEPLSGDDLDGFLAMARGKGLLESREQGTRSIENTSPAPGPQQSILHWRKNLFDPNRLFNWLEPKIRFFWTRGFLVLSACSIVAAMLVLWTNSYEATTSFKHALRLETVVWVWLTMIAVITLHEFAHGLTCKHYGGEVHEIGFLLLYFMPCFYCNVSDAWLFRERSKRLWVTFAGGYFQFLIWSLAVFIWRVTLPGSFPHYLSFIIVTYSGVETLFNFNPLIKLDGYYLLSDWLEVPNLHERGVNRFKANLRRWLWGAPRPDPAPRGGILFAYGLCSWGYSLPFLFVMLWGLFWFLGDRWGVTGMSAATVVGLVSTRRVLKDTVAGEARRMFISRHKRLVAWLLIVVGAAAVLVFVKIEDRVPGQFLIRPAVRLELRSAVSGFLKDVNFDEGDRVPSGSVVALLEIPDLASRIAQKQAEIREAQASVRLLAIGARPEEVVQLRERVDRDKRWRDSGQDDLDRLRQVLAEELAAADKQIAACQAELELGQNKYERAKSLVQGKAITDEEFQETIGNYRVAGAHLEKAQAERRAKQVEGTLKAETELTCRERQLAEAQAALQLLEAGSRPEQIEAERARLARLTEEANYLEQLQGRLSVCSSITGLIVTPRLKEKTGQYIHEGELIGVIEEPFGSDIEITLAEQDISRIQVGQTVVLKARALPFEKFSTKIMRIAPAAAQGDVQSSIIVYCPSGELSAQLRPGMTGFARVYSGRGPIGEVLLKKVLRFVRTEFWFCW